MAVLRWRLMGAHGAVCLLQRRRVLHNLAVSALMLFEAQREASGAAAGGRLRAIVRRLVPRVHFHAWDNRPGDAIKTPCPTQTNHRRVSQNARRSLFQLRCELGQAVVWRICCGKSAGPEVGHPAPLRRKRFCCASDRKIGGRRCAFRRFFQAAFEDRSEPR